MAKLSPLREKTRPFCLLLLGAGYQNATGRHSGDRHHAHAVSAPSHPLRIASLRPFSDTTPFLIAKLQREQKRDGVFLSRRAKA